MFKIEFEFEIYINETENCKKGKVLVAKSIHFLKESFITEIKPFFTESIFQELI